MAYKRADVTAPDPALELMRLTWAVDHQLQSVSKWMFRQIGLTAPQRLAVRSIGRPPGLTPGALAALLHLHPGTADQVAAAEALMRRVATELAAEHAG